MAPFLSQIYEVHVLIIYLFKIRLFAELLNINIINIKAVTAGLQMEMTYV
jgi:hypothetical protein